MLREMLRKLTEIVTLLSSRIKDDNSKAVASIDWEILMAHMIAFQPALLYLGVILLYC